MTRLTERPTRTISAADDRPSAAAAAAPTTLRKRLTESGPLTLEEASALLDQLAPAVDETHLEGYPHGAIRPENVLLLPDGTARLRAAASGGYYSPEERRGDEPTRAIDIWGLGALLYEVLTGVAPLPAIHPAALAAPGARWGARRLPAHVEDAQPVIDRALKSQPDDRYPSAQAMANALWEALPLPASEAETAIPAAAVAAPADSATAAEPTAEITEEITEEVTPVEAAPGDVAIAAATSPVPFVPPPPTDPVPAVPAIPAGTTRRLSPAGGAPPAEVPPPLPDSRTPGQSPMQRMLAAVASLRAPAA